MRPIDDFRGSRSDLLAEFKGSMSVRLDPFQTASVHASLPDQKNTYALALIKRTRVSTSK
jgi:hypothetical protein